MDDACLAHTYEVMVPPNTPRDYRKWANVRIEALNHALKGLPLPGVISHQTNVVEHPELVAEHLVRLAKLVGRQYHRRHRLRLRARAVRAARASVDHVGQAARAGRRRPAGVESLVAAPGGGLERGLTSPGTVPFRLNWTFR